MLKRGDKVKFLNQIGGGIIVRFQSKNIAVVENHDGFEIPVMINELVKAEEVESYDRVSRDYPKKAEPKVLIPEPEPEHIPEIIAGNDAPRFYMAFHPIDQQNPVSGEIEVYLINDSNFTLLYHYAHFDGETYSTIDAGELESNTKQYLEGISAIELSNLPRFWFRIIPFRKESRKLTDPVVKEISVNSVKFFREKSFVENDFFEGNAMILDLLPNPMIEEMDKLSEKDFKKLVNEKDKEYRTVEPKKEPVKIPEIMEVDLHIEELIDQTTGLSNREILDIQLEKFHHEMQLAIENRVKRIIFIHGVGNGVLKQEIAKKLQSTYARFTFQDASFQEYGFGATMVILRRK